MVIGILVTRRGFARPARGAVSDSVADQSITALPLPIETWHPGASAKSEVYGMAVHVYSGQYPAGRFGSWDRLGLGA